MLISIVLDRVDCESIAAAFGRSESVEIVINTAPISGSQLSALADKIEDAVRIKSYTG